MIQLLKTASKNNQMLLLKQLRLSLSIIAALLCTFLYSQFSGFLSGEHYAVALFRRNTLDFSGGGIPVYELISTEYVNAFFLTITSLLIFLFMKNLILEIVSFFILCFANYKYFEVFRLRSDILSSENFASSYYDLIRDTSMFNTVGAATFVSLLLIQLILILLLLRNLKANKLTV